MVTWRWFDVTLAVALGLMVGGLSCRTWVPVEPGPCDWGSGPCGCDPVRGPCVMPCTGCCPGWCRAQDPPPTSPR